MDPSTAIYLRYADRLNFKKRILTLFRYVEVVTLIAIALWSSARIPAAAGILVRHVIPVVMGPHFLFLIANVIVLSLLLLKPQSTTAETDKKISSSSSIADEISASFVPPTPARAEEEVVVFEDKRVCVEQTSEATPHQRRHARRTRRSRSNVSIDVEGAKRRSPNELRRVETDVGRVEMKDEEFRRMVEAFIEKQRRFRREESMAIVCSEELGEGFKVG